MEFDCSSFGSLSPNARQIYSETENKSVRSCLDQNAGQKGPLSPEMVFGPLARHRILSTTMQDCLSTNKSNPSTPRSNKDIFDSMPASIDDSSGQGLIWIGVCADILAAVRADGNLLIWTLENGERGIPLLTKLDVKFTPIQEKSMSSVSLGNDYGKIKRSILSSVFIKHADGNQDVSVGPHGMCPNDESEDGRCGVWSQRFALLERIGGRLLLSAGHPDGTVHCYSISAGQVSRMQVDIVYIDMACRAIGVFLFVLSNLSRLSKCIVMWSLVLLLSMMFEVVGCFWLLEGDFFFFNFP